MGVLVRELGILYEAYAEKRVSPLPELKIQYADFAQWQRRRMEQGGWKKQVEYWKKQLANAPEGLSLPPDRERPEVQSYRGKIQTWRVKEGIGGRLQELSREERVTPFMVLLGVLQVLLSWYSGENDVVVGTPVANRNRVETEGLIGFFVNTLVLRTDVSGNPSFRELLQRIRETALGAYAHQDVPFERLVQELRPERSLSTNPLFQVMFTLQNFPGGDIDLSRLKMRQVPIYQETAKFDLTIALQTEGERLRGYFEYNTDLFDDSTMERLGRHYERMLEGVIANAGQKIAELPWLTEEERRQVVEQWNRTERTGESGSVVDQFQKCAEVRGEALAVKYKGQELSYRELFGRSCELGR
jgi:non-ribosomal peptide synthetase component F